MTATIALYQPAPRATPAERAERLTTRRREVAILFARGLSAKLVADRLGISQRTAEAHLAEVYRVLEVRNVAQLAVLIYRAGMLGEEVP